MFPEPLRTVLIISQENKEKTKNENRKRKAKKRIKRLSMNWFCALTMRIKTSHSLQ